MTKIATAESADVQVEVKGDCCLRQKEKLLPEIPT